MSYQQGQSPQWPQQPEQPSNRYPPNQGWGYPQQYPSQWQQPPRTPYPSNPQWTPPPQGYPPQYYQQIPPQPPKKKSRAWLWIILGVAAVLVFSCIGISAIVASQNTASATNNTTSSSTNTSSSTSSSSSTPNTIGKPVVVDSDWTVTLNSANLGQPGQFDQLKAGDTLLIVNVSLRNTSSAVANASSLVQWSLHDSTGQTYNQDIVSGKSGPDGTIVPGGVIRGDIAYEVPANVHSFTLQFVAGIGSSDLAEWNVTV